MCCANLELCPFLIFQIHFFFWRQSLKTNKQNKPEKKKYLNRIKVLMGKKAEPYNLKESFGVFRCDPRSVAPGGLPHCCPGFLPPKAGQGSAGRVDVQPLTDPAGGGRGGGRAGASSGESGRHTVTAAFCLRRPPEHEAGTAAAGGKGRWHPQSGLLDTDKKPGSGPGELLQSPLFM